MRCVFLLLGNCCLFLAGCDSSDEIETQKSNGTAKPTGPWSKYLPTRTLTSHDVHLPDERPFGLIVSFEHSFERFAYSNRHGKQHPIVISEIASGESLLTLEGHSGSTQSLAFSMGDEWLVSCGEDGEVIAWDAVTGDLVSHQKHGSDYVRCVACSTVSPLAATAGDDRDIVIWSLPDLRFQRRLEGHNGGVRCLTWSRDGTRLLSGGWDGAVSLWDVQSGSRLASVNPGYGRVMSIALSPDRDYALASYLDGPDQPVILWDLKESREVDRFSIVGNPWHANRQLHVASCDFSSDGSEALLGIVFGTLVRWDVQAWSEIAFARMYTDELVCAQFSPVEDVILAVGSDEPQESVHLRTWKLGQVAQALPDDDGKGDD